MAAYDLIVVGAGPAGSAAAYHASRAGLRVLLLDRARFPRAKTCGDALAPRALAAVGRMGISTLPGHPIRGVRLVHVVTGAERYESFREHEAPHRGMVVERRVFDALLWQRAIDAGTEFRHAVARRVLHDGGVASGILVDAGRRSIVARAPCIVLATGAGTLPRLLGPRTAPRTRAWGVAGRCYLRIPAAFGDDFEFHLPVLDGDAMRSGYAWVFPVRPDLVNLGVGVFRRAAHDGLSIRALVARFVADRQATDARFQGAETCGPVESASIPIGPTMAPLANVLAAGDCASLPNGFTAEGISAALESGELAAAAATHGPDAGSWYRDRLAARRHPQAALATAFPDIHRHPWVFLGRGFDLLFGAERLVGNTIRRIAWELPPESRPGDGDAAACGAAAAWCDHVRGELVAGCRRLRPLLAEVVDRLTRLPTVGFGSLTTLAAAARVAEHPDRTQLEQFDRDVLLVLEALQLVAALDGDVGVAPELPGGGTWGRNSLGIVLADCVSAIALRRVLRLDAAWVRALGLLGAKHLRAPRPPGAQGGDPAGLRALAARLGRDGYTPRPGDGPFAV